MKKGKVTFSVPPTSHLVAPFNQLKPEPALGLVKDREAFGICSSGRGCHFHESLLNSQAQTGTSFPRLLRQSPFDIQSPEIGGTGVPAFALCSCKPRPLPGHFRWGFALCGFQGLSGHCLSACSILTCSPSTGSGPSGKTRQIFRLELLVPRQVVYCAVRPRSPSVREK